MHSQESKKNQKTFSLLLVLVCLVLFSIFMFVNRPKDCLGGYREDMTISIGSNNIVVERADNQQTRQKGLSDRACMPENTGMLFAFDRADLNGIWMKDMNFAIDILWLDTEKKIVHIEKNVSPNSYPKVYYPKVPALYVLEMSAGEAERIGVKVGDLLNW